MILSVWFTIWWRNPFKYISFRGFYKENARKNAKECDGAIKIKCEQLKNCNRKKQKDCHKSYYILNEKSIFVNHLNAIFYHVEMLHADFCWCILLLFSSEFNRLWDFVAHRVIVSVQLHIAVSLFFSTVFHQSCVLFSKFIYLIFITWSIAFEYDVFLSID